MSAAYKFDINASEFLEGYADSFIEYINEYAIDLIIFLKSNEFRRSLATAARHALLRKTETVREEYVEKNSDVVVCFYQLFYDAINTYVDYIDCPRTFTVTDVCNFLKSQGADMLNWVIDLYEDKKELEDGVLYRHKTMRYRKKRSRESTDVTSTKKSKIK